MVLQAYPIQRILTKFFPRKYTTPLNMAEWKDLPENQRKDLAINFLSQGELALLRGDLSGLSFFDAALQLDGESAHIWYRQGLAFFEYGSEKGQEKILRLAAKYFQYATQIDPGSFDIWMAWGSTLLQLGLCHDADHFYVEAREKYTQALSLSTHRPPEDLAELYWDYGIVWTQIAKRSGEAVDISQAIESFQSALQYQAIPIPECLHDCGKAYLEMGLLVNDPRFYLQAVHYLQRATEKIPSYFESWLSLAESYSQLYINTMDERFIAKASHAFQIATKLCPHSTDAWLSWAQILGESGRLNRDAKRLKQSVEACAKAFSYEPQDPLIVAQWVESLSLLGVITNHFPFLVEAEQKILKAFDLHPDDPDLWHAYGICLMGLGHYYGESDYYEMAIEKIQHSLSIDRTIAEHWHTLGNAHRHLAALVHHEDLLERACRFLFKAMDLKPSCPALLFDTACTLLQLSEVVDNLPALQNALVLFESLLQSHKTVILQHPEWLFEYACGLEWLADFSAEEVHLHRAIDIFSHVLLIDPDYPQIHQRISRCYMELGHHTGDAEFYKKAISFCRLALRQDEENDALWLDWGLCLIHLAHHTLDGDFMNQLYWDAEQKIIRAGSLGNCSAHYHLACLYSILGRTLEAMEYIRKSLSARTLPPIEDLLEDEWLDNLRHSPHFIQFLSALEAKLQAREQ